jgi:hypothetical protein
MQTEDKADDNFVVWPANNGGSVLTRRSDIAGGRPNDNGGCILYLRSGPSVYVAATIAQVGRALGAETAELRRE